MIRLSSTIPLPHAIMTGHAAAAMPRAAEILDQLSLW
jgi:hypothetical protein